MSLGPEHPIGPPGTRRRRDYAEALRQIERAAREADRTGADVELRIRVLPLLTDRPHETGAMKTSAFAPLAL